MIGRDGVLIGGMHDGAVITGMGGRDYWRMPNPVAINYGYGECSDPWVVPAASVYRLALTCGMPSLDDRGRYRYEYAGTQ